ncbi:MAG: haloacid dehalogenase [Actinomycetia bacterium]|nr:haloacid dehalogenase [Actinomycetes bacterium]
MSCQGASGTGEERGVSEASKITLACLDLAGTTVGDHGLVESAFVDALATLGIVAGTAAFDQAMIRVRESRGRPKVEIFRQLIPEGAAGGEVWARTANLSFERSYDAAIDRVGLAPVPGAEAALDKLAGAGVRLCLMTGFSRGTLGRVLDTLDWWKRVDLVICPDDVGGRGRPWPDLVLTAALRLQVEDVRHVAVCGDTASDILSGRRAGASIVAGVLTGAHDREQLLGAGATHVIDSIVDLPDLVLGTTG